MEPAYFIRVLRTRWRVLAACLVIGALLGLGTTFLAEEEAGPTEVYWSATNTLIVNSDAAAQGRFPNLLQTALRVTGGEVLATVSAQLEIEETELKSRLRTVTDLEVVSLDISAVSTDRDVAKSMVDVSSQSLIDFLTREEKAVYDAQVAEAQTEVDTITDALDDLDQQIADLSELIVAFEEAEAAQVADEDRDPAEVFAEALAEDNERPRADPREELRLAQLERDTRFTIFQDALNQLDSIVAQGEPRPLLEILDTIPPFQISEGQYSQRIRQGREGNNNFTTRDLQDDGGGGVSLSETVSSPLVRGILGALAGLLAGIGLVLMYLRLDPRLRSKMEIEEAFGLPVLAEIPAFERKTDPLELHTLSHSRSVVAEAYRMVRSALLFARNTAGDVPSGASKKSGKAGTSDATNSSDDVRVVMVTSPGPAEGKTTTTANLAVVLAEAGYEVLVVNCDYRLPKLHKYFGLDFESRRTMSTDVPGVTVVADVTPEAGGNPTSVVEAQRALITKARDRYDVVLLDTAPMLATNDALGVLSVADLVVVVCKEGRTDREGAEECGELLRRRDAKVAGVVVVGASGYGRSKYYYKYRYGNYYSESATTEAHLGRTDAGQEPVLREI